MNAVFDYEAPANLLENRVILVTGASAGIGKAAALRFAELGATVVLLARNMESLEKVYDEIEAANCPQPALVPLNMETAGLVEYQQIAAQLEAEFGRLDGLLLNAGILGDLRPLEHYSQEMFERVMRINVTGQFLLYRATATLLRASADASVVFTSSSVGRVGRAHWGAYAVSKFAVEGMMQTLADELANTSHVRVNCINPGATRTSMRAAAYPGEDPATICPPAAIMPLYCYLMGPDSRDVNGQSLDAQIKPSNA